MEKAASTHNTDYQLQPDGSFVIKNYNQKKQFSNFLPGIAGLYGTPMWAFYVNRGQGIASFGTRNKDNAILEFFPANKAYQNTAALGFRTFIKIAKKKGFVTAEPFLRQDTGRAMRISSHEFTL